MHLGEERGRGMNLILTVVAWSGTLLFCHLLQASWVAEKLSSVYLMLFAFFVLELLHDREQIRKMYQLDKRQRELEIQSRYHKEIHNEEIRKNAIQGDNPSHN